MTFLCTSQVLSSTLRIGPSSAPQKSLPVLHRGFLCGKKASKFFRPGGNFVTAPGSLLRLLCGRMVSSAPKSILPYQSYKDAPNYDEFRNHGFTAQRLEEVMDAVNFKHWDQFCFYAEAAKQKLGTVALDHRTILTKHLTSEDFETDLPQALELLSKIASDNDGGLSGIRILAGEPAYTYGPTGASHCVLHDVGIYTASTDMSPDAGVRATEAWENAQSLLPSHGTFKSVADAYNSYFRSYRQRNGASTIFDDCLLNQISEVILTAMHTRSGWYCLHRKSEAIFMRIDPVQAPGTRWLTVYVSDIYAPGDKLSILDGLLALFNGCKAAHDAKVKQFGDMTTRLMSITALMYKRRVSGDNKGDESEDQLLDESDPLSLSQDEKRMLKRATDGETMLKLNCGELVRFFLVHCCGYLGTGRSGYVVRSRVNGAYFAVKRWNRYEWDAHACGDGILDLSYEIEVYAYLHKFHPHVLGRIVPRPVATCCEKDLRSERALVMTMVGEEIVMKGQCLGSTDDTEQVWTMNGKVLREEDKREIMKQRENNLKELHGLGIVDSDPLFNCRVGRVQEENGERRWHVWTVDLGQCRVHHHGTFLELDSLRSLIYGPLPT